MCNGNNLAFQRFRQKPVHVRAAQITESMTVEAGEGRMRGEPGDWLIIGVDGERSFCKDSIFRQTYEAVRGGVRWLSSEAKTVRT